MFTLTPSNRLAVETAHETARFGSPVIPSLPPVLQSIASDLVVIGLLQMLADAKEQAERDSATIEALRKQLLCSQCEADNLHAQKARQVRFLSSYLPLSIVLKCPD
jgi:hypothetical protein